jgi:hypothetical protein
MDLILRYYAEYKIAHTTLLEPAEED